MSPLPGVGRLITEAASLFLRATSFPHGGLTLDRAGKLTRWGLRGGIVKLIFDFRRCVS